MVKVSIEVSKGAAHFNVAVRAQSIERAMSVVRGSFPECDVKVKFPIDPEGLFVKETVPQSGVVGGEQLDLITA